MLGRRLRARAVKGLVEKAREIEGDAPMSKRGTLARSAIAQAERWVNFCEGREEDVKDFLEEALK